MMPKITMFLLIVIPFLPWGGKYIGHFLFCFACLFLLCFFYFVVVVVVVARTQTIQTFFVVGIAYA